MAMSIRTRSLWVVALLATGGLFGMLGKTLLWPSTAPNTSTVQAAPETPAVRTVEKVVITPSTVKVYAKPAAKKLGVEQALQPSESVISASTIDANDDRPKTVITLIDESTGESRTLVKTEPAPWLAPDTRGGVRLDYGYAFPPSGAPRPVTRLTVRQDFVRVKDFHAGVVGSIDTAGNKFVGVGVEYRW